MRYLILLEVGGDEHAPDWRDDGHYVHGDTYDEAYEKASALNLFGYEMRLEECPETPPKEENPVTEKRCWDVPLKDIPQVKSVWQHRSSKDIYHVIVTTNMFATKREFVPTVVYTDRDGKVWSRPLSEFLNKFSFVSLSPFYNQELVNAIQHGTTDEYVCLGHCLDKYLYVVKGVIFVRWGDGDDMRSRWHYQELLYRLSAGHNPAFSPELEAARRYYEKQHEEALVTNALLGIVEHMEKTTPEEFFDAGYNRRANMAISELINYVDDLERIKFD